MKNGLLRDLVILICPKRNFWQPLSTQIFSRVLWCAEIAAVLTFWAFRGKSIHARVWKWPWPWGNPQLKITVHCLKYLRFYNHVWSNDLNAHTFWQHHFDSTRISQNHTWQSAAGWFLFFYITCCFFKMKIYPPCQSTWNLKISHWERAFVLKTIIPSFHVRFRGCIIGSLTIAPIDITQK